MTGPSGRDGSGITGARGDDTIVAIATPPGRGALAIVRMSGSRALEIGVRLISPFPAEPKRATLAHVNDSDGQVLDEVVVVTHRGPASFTGEDTVELTSHGGAMTPATIAAAFVAAGARPAEPGEFTRRAVLNGKLDVLQAEAVGDLIDATTRSAQRVALGQLDGGLSRRINALRASVVDLEALCAYDIDFPDEDDGPIAPTRILDAVAALIDDLDRLVATAPLGEIVRHGAVVVIAGAPNVGKSSLFNAMLGRRRAIVNDTPGTTRDALEAVTDADGWPIRLVDTAGLRDATDVVERMGVEISREYLESADVILACGDSAASLRAALAAVAGISRGSIVPVRTKWDLAPDGSATHDGAVPVSAETGEGLRDLSGAIGAALASSNGPLTLDAPVITRERQRVGLERARTELHLFRDAWQLRSVPPSVAAVHLRASTRELEEVVGVIDLEDVLDRLFSSFCVGK